MGVPDTEDEPDRRAGIDARCQKAQEPGGRELRLDNGEAARRSGYYRAITLGAKKVKVRQGGEGNPRSLLRRSLGPGTSRPPPMLHRVQLRTSQTLAGAGMRLEESMRVFHELVAG